MKKALAALLALTLLSASVFGAVNFTGTAVAGYAFQNNGTEWKNWIYGEDGEDTNTTRMEIGISDDGGIWGVDLEGYLISAEDGSVGGDVYVDLAKLIANATSAGDTEWSAKLSLNVMDRLVGYRAYSMQKDLDRVRTAETGLWTSFELGYSNLVKVMIAGSPATEESVGDNMAWGVGANEGDFMVSALVNPLDGLGISATYVLKGDANDSGNDRGTEGFAGGIVSGTVNVDLARLLGLDYSLGLAASDKYEIEGNNNIFSVALYGGIDFFHLTAQYGLKSYSTEVNGVGDEHFLYVGAGFDIIKGLVLNVYGGAYDLGHADDSWYLGGDIGYTISNVTFKLALEYGAGASFEFDDNYWNDDTQSGKGFWIVPSIAVAW